MRICGGSIWLILAICALPQLGVVGDESASDADSAVDAVVAGGLSVGASVAASVAANGAADNADASDGAAADGAADRLDVSDGATASAAAAVAAEVAADSADASDGMAASGAADVAADSADASDGAAAHGAADVAADSADAGGSMASSVDADVATDVAADSAVEGADAADGADAASAVSDEAGVAAENAVGQRAEVNGTSVDADDAALEVLGNVSGFMVEDADFEQRRRAELLESRAEEDRALEELDAEAKQRAPGDFNETEVKAMREARRAEMQELAEAEVAKAQERLQFRDRFNDRMNKLFLRSSLPESAEDGAQLLQQERMSEEDSAELTELADELSEHDAYEEEHLADVHRGTDADGDGLVSLQELLAFEKRMRNETAFRDVVTHKNRRQTTLGQLDADGDGRLNFTELPDVGDPEHTSAMFKAADADGSGFLEAGEVPSLFYPELSPAVLQVAARSTLGQRDADGDGLLTMEELYGPHLDMEESPKEDFKWLDKDNSGKLDEKEMVAFESREMHTQRAMDELLHLADRDADGHLSAEELRRARRRAARTRAHFHLKEWAENLNWARYTARKRSRRGEL
eukprot:TRINITY_DN17149_c0_g1_i1.p1 TRINITY_DN17149_c0_g1~~TRINITY_DN17149_c0_g1_i1.p1  ORF type:complete len:614 (-),score=202.34 TRINITY_DN17149_c0_g1_i1:70-1818(-)